MNECKPLVSGNTKYLGGAALGDSLYFTPATVADVGVLNTTSGVFSTIATG